MSPCPFCECTDYKKSYLPSTYFHNKRFDVVECRRCGLQYLFPFPSLDDYIAMYPPSYQEGVDKTILKNLSEKLPGLRYSYQYKINLIQRFVGDLSRITLLDYGCGNANFVVNLNHYGIRCDGTEFNSLHVKILREAIPESNFYTIDDFLAEKTPKYDVIHLSNVLEHLDKPFEIVQKIVSRLNPNGILLVEGPLEDNFSFAFLTRKWYFNLRNLLQPSWVACHVPTHIFFSNYKNQRNFFRRIHGLQELHYEAKEEPWPYPEFKEQAKNAVDKIKYYIGQFSKKISMLNSTWGNTFIYVGRKTT
ncbi:MAG: class I SAM-dependent methyltransferase [Cytophagales bacterium]|nr:class I SAM-dependent methyltransferase [Cytophagales bacterium]MDW8384885.1 class I SAM-dependent methyltransferase [Flammeovirgaceae bacterium]